MMMMLFYLKLSDSSYTLKHALNSLLTGYAVIV